MYEGIGLWFQEIRVPFTPVLLLCLTFFFGTAKQEWRRRRLKPQLRALFRWGDLYYRTWFKTQLFVVYIMWYITIYVMSWVYDNLPNEWMKLWRVPLPQPRVSMLCIFASIICVFKIKRLVPSVLSCGVGCYRLKIRSQSHKLPWSHYPVCLRVDWMCVHHTCILVN